MNQRLSESFIIRALAEDVAQRITRRSIAALQKITEGLGSGDDSELKTVWDEVCVQMQFEQSVMWEAYEQTCTVILAGDVEELKPHERDALWLQTQQAQDWDCEDEAESYPVFNDDIVQYLFHNCLLREAGRWSNPRIRAYLDRATATD